MKSVVRLPPSQEETIVLRDGVTFYRAYEIKSKPVTAPPAVQSVHARRLRNNRVAPTHRNRPVATLSAPVNPVGRPTGPVMPTSPATHPINPPQQEDEEEEEEEVDEDGEQEMPQEQLRRRGPVQKPVQRQVQPQVPSKGQEPIQKTQILPQQELRQEQKAQEQPQKQEQAPESLHSSVYRASAPSLCSEPPRPHNTLSSNGVAAEVPKETLVTVRGPENTVGEFGEFINIDGVKNAVAEKCTQISISGMRNEVGRGCKNVRMRGYYNKVKHSIEQADVYGSYSHATNSGEKVTGVPFEVRGVKKMGKAQQMSLLLTGTASDRGIAVLTNPYADIAFNRLIFFPEPNCLALVSIRFVVTNQEGKCATGSATNTVYIPMNGCGEWKRKEFTISYDLNALPSPIQFLGLNSTRFNNSASIQLDNGEGNDDVEAFVNVDILSLQVN